MMCSKCNKRVATVFVTKVENGQDLVYTEIRNSIHLEEPLCNI